MQELWFRWKVFSSVLTHFKKQGRVKRYFLPLLLTLLIIIPKVLFYDYWGNTSAFLLLTLVVTLSSWFGGMGPGLLATILAAISNIIFFMVKDPQYFLSDFLLTTIFISEGVFISTISEARSELEEQKDEFIGFAAHELKNPLATVKGYAGLLAGHAKKNSDRKTQQFSEEINAQTNILLELINDLLDVTKIEIGKFFYKKEYFCLGDLVKEVVENQRIINKNRTIELKGSSSKIVFGDSYRIGQVIVNLVTNALKYSGSRDKIRLKIKNCSSKEVMVLVKDFGVGIAKTEQQRIFQRFYRTPEAVRGKSQGLGLGLFICQKIIAEHQGKIWVKSKEHKGSTFYFSLPVTHTKNLNSLKNS